MSDLRLNYSKTAFDTILDILSDLTKIQKNKEFAILGWGKRILNYGIKQSDFNNNYFVSSEKQFRDNKIELEEFRFIQTYDKNQRVKHGPKYAITPFGLFFLLKHRRIFTIERVFEYFSRIYLNKIKTISRNSWKFFDQRQIDKAIKMLFDNMEFDYDNQKLIMTLYAYDPKSFNKTVLTQVITSTTYIKVTKPKPLTKDLRQYVTRNELDFGLAYFFRDLLCYYLFINTPKKQIKDIPNEFRIFCIVIINFILNESAFDFNESQRRYNLAYGEDSPKLVSILSKDKFNKIIERLE